jgi:hypothetical protein
VVSDDARRHQYVDRLCDVTGLDRATAEDVVDAVNPTGKRKKRPQAGDHAPSARIARSESIGAGRMANPRQLFEFMATLTGMPLSRP